MVGGTAAFALALGAGGPTPLQAQDPATVQELQKRLEALEKQNQILMQMIQQQQQTSSPQTEAGAVAAPGGASKDEVQKIVKDYLKEEADKKKKQEEEEKKKKEEEGFTVGENVDFKFKWDGGQLWGETADKAFRFHVGGRTQADSVWYNTGDNVMYGNNGVGRVDDGVEFRRARFAMEGTLWEVMDFNMEYDFLNTETEVRNVAQTVTKNAAGVVTNDTVTPTLRPYDTPVPTDLWIQFHGIPGIGSVRVGNLKYAIGFEHNTSSRFLNFMERSYAFDAFIGGPDNGFAPGVMVFNNFMDDRFHVAVSLTKFNQTIYAFNTGDGEWNLCTRVGGFPIWEHDGRYAMWVGCGYSHHDPDFIPQTNRQFAAETPGQVRLRARSELRNGPAELHTPLLDIFPVADSGDLLVPELAIVAGPWTIQAEYFGNWLNNARSTPTSPSVGTQFTQAAYAEVLYFLTGEHRVFNRKTPGFGRVVPNENAWVLNGCKGLLVGRGAWQLAARYSWIDLNDKGLLGGTGMAGSAQALTLGVNWFLNPNMKIQWNYTYEQRYQINTVATTSPSAGLLPNLPSDGALRGFGMRFAMDW